MSRLSRRSPGVQVVLVGGLGNQLFQLSAGLSASRGAPLSLLELRQLQRNGRSSDLRGLSNLGETCRLTPVDPLMSGVLAKAVGRMLHDQTRATSGGNNIPSRWMLKSRLARMLVKSWLHSNILNWSDSTTFSETEPGTPGLLIGYYQDADLVLDTGAVDAIRSLMPPPSTEKMAALALEARNQRPTVVHMRLGDYRGIRQYGCLGPEYFSNSLQILDVTPDQEIWLFSDEPVNARDILREAGARNIRLPELELGPDTPPASLMSLMSMGHRFIISNSTFAWWAASLSESPIGIVAPEPWFKTGTPLGLLPEAWHKAMAVWLEK